jgi:type VI secretion system secreted protein VgrG
MGDPTSTEHAGTESPPPDGHTEGASTEGASTEGHTEEASHTEEGAHAEEGGHTEDAHAGGEHEGGEHEGGEHEGGEHGGGEHGGGEHGGGEHGGGEHEGGEHGGGEHGGGEHGGESPEFHSQGGKVFGGVADGLDGIAELVHDHNAQEALHTGAEVSRSAAHAAETAHEIEAVAPFVPAEARHALEGIAHALGGVEQIAEGLGGGHGGGHGEGHGGGHGEGGHGEEGHGEEGHGEEGHGDEHGREHGRGHGEEHERHARHEHPADLLEEIAENDGEIDIELEIDGLHGHIRVANVSIDEELSALPIATISATVGDVFPEVRELHGKDCALTISRPAQMRHFRGVIVHAKVHGNIDDSSRIDIKVVPALWLLKKTLDSRIYQDKTVVEVVEHIIEEHLGSRRRTIRVECERTYPALEYIVQYQESHYNFLARLLEQEGIFYYFDHDAEDHEVLVITDTVQGLPVAREHVDGHIPYAPAEDHAAVHEAITSAHHDEHIGVRNVVVGEHNWMRPRPQVRSTREQEAEFEPTLEIFDHTDAFDFHGTDYSENTADWQAQIRQERLELNLQKWTMHSTCVSIRAGFVFEMEDCDDEPELNGRYVTVRSHSRGSPSHGEHYSWQASLEVIPATMPYRPPRRTAKVVVPGPETAIVVGPDDPENSDAPQPEEIHVDAHGRIKVHFHWDRLGEYKEHASCWIRVAQTWAGAGWGTMFIPRVGMEVVVSFLGGDPDRPLVTGCVYNGANAVPYALPANKTRSTIKTNSSLGGEGYNELRFEDKKGDEEVWIHAQKDMNEVVEHDHTTRVKHNQSNTVDNDQTESIGHDQTLTVHNDRRKTVKKNETTTIELNRDEEVWANELVYVKGIRSHTIKGDEKLEVQEGARTVEVTTGKDTETYNGGRETTVLAFEVLNVNGGANMTTTVTGQYNISSTGQFKVTQNSINEVMLADSLYAAVVGRIQLKAGDGAVHYDAMPSGVFNLKGTELNLEGTSKIFLKVGGSSIEMTSSKVTIASPTVEVNGQSLVDVKSGGLVKLKC